jgi:hypothetical protein
MGADPPTQNCVPRNTSGATTAAITALNSQVKVVVAADCASADDLSLRTRDPGTDLRRRAG